MTAAQNRGLIIVLKPYIIVAEENPTITYLSSLANREHPSLLLIHNTPISMVVYSRDYLAWVGGGADETHG